LIFAELKRGPGSRLTPEQHHWLTLLQQCPGVEAYMWTPADWQTIEWCLMRRGVPD
jgi:hypothetical protein